MKVIKRNGSEVVFDITKIITAITKANDAVEEEARMTPMQQSLAAQTGLNPRRNRSLQEIIEEKDIPQELLSLYKQP